MFRIALMVCTLLPVTASAQYQTRYQDQDDPANWDMKTRIEGLGRFLLSLTDEEYDESLRRYPEAADSPYLVSRTKALGAVYNTLAGLEYQEAALGGPVEAGRAYQEDYDRVAGPEAKNLAVDPKTKKKKGWGAVLLKMLGKAAINYVRFGVPIPVGRQIGSAAESRSAVLAENLAGLRGKLANAEPGSKEAADLHFQVGRVYEELAASAGEPDSEAARTAKKKSRLRELAGILETFSDEDYQEALSQTSDKTANDPILASRGKVLKSAYTTLAALEYHQAAKQAPQEVSAEYSGTYQRVSRDGADDLVVNPESLEEAGWFSKLLTIGALGGMGYLAYDQYKKHGRSEDAQNLAEAVGAAPEPVEPAPEPDPIPEPVIQPKPPEKDIPPPTKRPEPRFCTMAIVPVPGEPNCYWTNGCRKNKVCRDQPIISPVAKNALKAEPGDSKVVDLYDSLGGLEAHLAATGGGAEVTAGLHYKMGSVYEQLASSTIEGSAAEAAPAKKKVRKEKKRELTREEQRKLDMREMEEMSGRMNREMEERKKNR